jgi:acetylornithine deacetylase
MRVGSPDCRVSTTQLRCVGALAPDNGSYAESLVLGVLRGNRVQSASYATEAGLFQEAGMPTVICGPGSIEQAHKPNEFIEIDELEACVGFMQRLVDTLSA